jgi:hypothetical protein
MNREKYALHQISQFINKIYNVNICLCCNNIIKIFTHEYMIHRNFGVYYMNVINHIYAIIKIDVTAHSISEMDYVYDILKLIETY